MSWSQRGGAGICLSVWRGMRPAVVLALAVAALAAPIKAAAWIPLCQELWNPHGQTTPPAGNTTCPGSKGGQNEDGFYQVGACDGTWVAHEPGFGGPVGPVGNPIFAEPSTCNGEEGTVVLVDGCGDGPTGWVYNPISPEDVVTDPTIVIKYTENGAKPDEKKIGNLDNPNADGVYKHYNGQGDLMVCDAQNGIFTFTAGTSLTQKQINSLLEEGICTCCYVPPPPKDSVPSNPNTTCPPLSIQ